MRDGKVRGNIGGANGSRISPPFFRFVLNNQPYWSSDREVGWWGGGRGCSLVLC